MQPVLEDLPNANYYRPLIYAAVISLVYLLALAAFALEWAAARRLEPVGAPAAVLVGTEGAPIEGAEAVSADAGSVSDQWPATGPCVLARPLDRKSVV